MKHMTQTSHPVLGVEYFTCGGDLVYRTMDGEMGQLAENDKDHINFIVQKFQELYPGAVAGCKKIYKNSHLNFPYYQHLVASRLCRCNFGRKDSLRPDIDKFGNIHLEDVECPLKGGLCEYEGIICKPSLNSDISSAEMIVLKLLFEGMDRGEIANELHKSPHTINNQIRTMRTRVGVDSTSELIAYAAKHNLIKCE